MALLGWYNVKELTLKFSLQLQQSIANVVFQ